MVPAAGDPVSTALFHTTLYAAAAGTLGYEEHIESLINESQPLLSPDAPIAEVLNTGRRIVQSQLTTSTGLGDDFISSDKEEEKEDDGSFHANVFDKNYDDIDDDGVDANVNDYAADKYDFNERMHHYMEFNAISSRNVTFAQLSIVA